MRQDKSKINLNVEFGEIVQVFNVMPDDCIVKTDTTNKPRIVRLYPESNLISSKWWSISLTDTTTTILERYLADIPVISFEDLLFDFGLSEAANIPISTADADVRFRLNVLKAILEGAQVIQIISPWKISDATDFILNAKEFAIEQAETRSGDAPAFAIFDGDATSGITLNADRVLRPVKGQMREMEVCV